MKRPPDRGSTGHLVAALMAGAGLVSCSKACPTRGCQTQFAAGVSATTASLPAGTHRIDVIADGALLSCTFAFPLETLPGGGTVAPLCSSGLAVSVSSALDCTEVKTSFAATLSCVPIPDQFEERIEVTGTPSVVAIEQSVGGAVILQRSATPVYEDTQPNGPDCEPTCRQASVQWSIP